MDYLSRIVGGVSPSPTRRAGFNVPQQRLLRFRKAHDHLQLVWRKINSSRQLVPEESVLACLETIKNTLQDEAYTPAPHLCARHVSTFQVYMILVQVSSSYQDAFIIHEVLDIFKILIDSEEVEFLEDQTFADALIGFVGKISSTGQLIVSVDTEARSAEVLFGIASRIRLQPQLLTTWFRPFRSHAEVAAKAFAQAGSEFNTRTDKDVFPLFYLTLDYVHHDGRVGDFARTGLLYLIETATHSEALEKWIVEGDLATLMASGLGALYSQLSRKLVLSFPVDLMPATVSFPEFAPAPISHDAEETNSPEFRAHLTTFLSYLTFWQDVLEHCNSTDVKQSLLDHFKLLFLQQLLYPSLIESSDMDGGSSVAVLTYLRCIIESVDHPDLLHVILQYLLALPEKHEEDTTPVRPTALARRRKSSMLITTLARGQEKPMPDLFTLVDLVLTGLRSNNQQTVTATLQLVSVILDSQHQYAVGSIIKVHEQNGVFRSRTLDAHARDTASLFSMAEDLTEHDDLGEMYEAHLQDARTLLESHCCSLQILALPILSPGTSPSLTQEPTHPSIMQPHQVQASDPLVESLVSLLDNFLSNDPATNISLSRTFSALASCGNTGLDTWLLGDPDERDSGIAHDKASDDGSDQDITITLSNATAKESNVLCAAMPRLHPSGKSNGAAGPVFATLDGLVRRVERFRHEIQQFDAHLADRRHFLKVGAEIDNAVTNDLPLTQRVSEQRNSGESVRSSAPRSRAVGQIGSITERLMSGAETSSSDISRSSSPRGRQPNEIPSSTIAGRLSHLRISPSPSPSKLGSRAFSSSPLREESFSSTTSNQALKSMGITDALGQRVKVDSCLRYDRLDAQDVGSEASSMRSSSTTAETKKAEVVSREITLSHLLTNVIILQEFVLGLAAIIEVRAALFGEIRFT